MTSHVDVAIVGAGAAGIAAGQAVRAAGVSYVVLEASGRIGGRALTDYSLDYPADLGCTWLHSADENILADGPEALYGKNQRVDERLYLEHAGHWASAEEQAEADAYVDAMEDKIAAAGNAGEDTPVAALLEDSPYKPLFEWWCGAYTGVPTDEIGALDWARYRETHQNWTVRGGMGTMIAGRAEGLAVRRETPVLTIDHRPANGVRLTTPAGVLTASAVIITTSTTALSRIVFLPSLPDAKEAALERLPLGLANKAIFRFDALDPEWGHAWSERISAGFGRFGAPIAELYIEASVMRALEPAKEPDILAFAADRLADMFGNGIKARIKGARASTWGTTPWIWGAYSAMTPGGGDPRAALAEPIDGRLFFAGEATHSHFFSAAHGAWESGQRAAAEALRALT